MKLLTTLRSRRVQHSGGAVRSDSARRSWLMHVAQVSPSQLLAELNAHEHGLSEEEVEASRALYGRNVIAQHERPGALRRLVGAFADPFTYILVFIAIVSVLTDWVFAPSGSRELTTPAIIGAMVLVSGVLRFIQESKSGDAIEALSEMIETTCNVEREGVGRCEVGLDEVVVGDIVHLSSGDLVPADIRLIHARDLFVSQSSLTGESGPVDKDAAELEVGGSDPAVTDVSCLVFLGSNVISGTATGVVVATGRNTLLGETAGTLTEKRRATAFDLGVASTSRLLVRLMLVMVPAVFLISGVTKNDWLSALLFSLSLAVGLTPEMLPMLVTTCLAKGAVDMSHDKVIVKRLDAIQDLGSIDILCCDKTGTLTEDRIVLQRHINVNGEEDTWVLNCAFLNSFFETGLKNLIDSAIIRRATELDREVGDLDELCETYHLVDELPFDFERRRVSVVVGDSEGRTTMVCKGAIEEVVAACGSVDVDGAIRPLTPELERRVMAQAETLADKGMRVLGVAIKENPSGVGTLSAADECDMVLIGYLAFLDPPKESAAPALAALDAFGVDVKVLTGDSPRVAAHVCSTLGILRGAVVTGADVDRMDDAELIGRVEGSSVFAKLSPSQKARVVEALHACGHNVGYMGDGVNDAAAMRASDCGISVDSAVDVAREAADIILLEKDLGVLEHGIEVGRRTYANIIKYVKITVSSNFGNIISVLVASALLPFLPMTAVQLLLLNLIYDLSCVAIPWDGVDESMIRRPESWDSASIKRFMLRMGPLSSVFDIIAFAVMFFWVCPTVAGGAWDALDPAGRAVFAGTFQAGWFIMSMWTQTLAVQFFRTEKVPFIQSRPALPITVLAVAGILVAAVVPYSPAAEPLGFAAPPFSYFVMLGCVLVAYATSLAVARRLYVRRYGSLL